jgi:hypothetical protein
LNQANRAAAPERGRLWLEIRLHGCGFGWSRREIGLSSAGPARLAEN